MKKSLLGATATLALVTFGSVAHADGWYVRADVGAVLSGTLDHENRGSQSAAILGNSDLEEAYTFSTGLGYAFEDNFRLEAAIGYREGDLDVPAATVGGLPSLNFTADPRGDVEVIDIMLNGLYDLPGTGKLSPFVGLGLGLIDIEVNAANLFSLGGPGGYVNVLSDSDTGFAYQGLAGLAYKLSDQVTLDLTYKYLGTTGLDLEGTNGLLGIATPYDADYSDHTASVGLRWAFGDRKSVV